MNESAPPKASDSAGKEARASGTLRLYVAHATPNSILAKRNLLDALMELDDGGAGLGLEIIDVFTEPLRALADSVFVTPTLVGLKANERLMISGDLSDSAKIKFVLASLQHDKTVEKLTALVVAKERVLADKVVLANEMSYRVKNNFQLVEGLLIVIGAFCPRRSKGRRLMQSLSASGHWRRCTANCSVLGWNARSI
jgi:two-component sensor histidine kinase